MQSPGVRNIEHERLQVEKYASQSTTERTTQAPKTDLCGGKVGVVVDISVGEVGGGLHIRNDRVGRNLSESRPPSPRYICLSVAFAQAR